MANNNVTLIKHMNLKTNIFKHENNLAHDSWQGLLSWLGSCRWLKGTLSILCLSSHVYGENNGGKYMWHSTILGTTLDVMVGKDTKFLKDNKRFNSIMMVFFTLFQVIVTKKKSICRCSSQHLGRLEVKLCFSSEEIWYLFAISNFTHGMH